MRLTTFVLIGLTAGCATSSTGSSGGAPAAATAPAATAIKHLSSKTGDLETPFPGKDQTSAVVLDVDKDGTNDFIVAERTSAPAAVWYRRHKTGWARHIVEAEAMRIEAGANIADVDGDGDIDFVGAGDNKSKEIWWWENPHPNHAPDKAWTRRTIHTTKLPKHHDLIFGDFDGDGREEIAVWNQRAGQLLWGPIPADPKDGKEWPLVPIYTYEQDSEPTQRGSYPTFKKVNEHEGLAKLDIDGDGKLDIVGGAAWFKHVGGDRFETHPVDPSYRFTRSAAGQLKAGGRPEIVLVAGDGQGPLVMYEWTNDAWKPQILVESIQDGHSLGVLDINGDGHLDIYCAEMRVDGRNPESKVYFLIGDGAGNFKTLTPVKGFDLHESKVADLDGNGTMDILGKPFNHDTPSINIWLDPLAGSQ